MKKFNLKKLDLEGGTILKREEMKLLTGGFVCPSGQNVYVCQPCGNQVCAGSATEYVYKCLAANAQCPPY